MEEKKLREQRQNRSEIGAMWKKKARTKDSEYMTIRLRLDREKLLQLLEDSNGSELIEYNMVSFPNNGSDENESRPAFRIFEDLR